MQTFLALGSNMGDSKQILREAIAKLPDDRKISKLYETEPFGGVKQANFFNLVVTFETDMNPRELLQFCQQLEEQANRQRTVRWGPRTLDVDIILYGDITVDEPDLSIPHVSMHSRDFVMAPLLDLKPNYQWQKPDDYFESIVNRDELDLSKN